MITCVSMFFVNIEPTIFSNLLLSIISKTLKNEIKLYYISIKELKYL